MQGMLPLVSHGLSLFVSSAPALWDAGYQVFLMHGFFHVLEFK